MSTNDKIELEPYPIDTSIDYVRIYIENFQLNAIEGWVNVYEYDKNDKFINVSRVYIPPDVYSEWATDDNYIIEYALDQLGFHRRPTVSVEFPI